MDLVCGGPEARLRRAASIFLVCRLRFLLFDGIVAISPGWKPSFVRSRTCRSAALPPV